MGAVGVRGSLAEATPGSAPNRATRVFTAPAAGGGRKPPKREREIDRVDVVEIVASERDPGRQKDADKDEPV